jgi:hypothetical protein
METEFVFISNQSTDKNLQKYYTNFKKLIDFIKERKLYAENSDFYNKKITEINDIISRDFHEKYDKEGKNIIAKNFSEITVFLADKHNLHKKINFLQYFFRLECFFEWRLE